MARATDEGCRSVYDVHPTLTQRTELHSNKVKNNQNNKLVNVEESNTCMVQIAQCLLTIYGREA